MPAQLSFLLEGVLGLSSVILGAFGTHALRSKITEKQMHSFETAVRYHMSHTIAMLAVQVASAVVPPKAAAYLRVTRYLFAGGIVLFSGSIYAQSFGLPKIPFPVAPVGGLMMMGGWTLLAISSFV